MDGKNTIRLEVSSGVHPWCNAEVEGSSHSGTDRRLSTHMASLDDRNIGSAPLSMGLR